MSRISSVLQVAILEVLADKTMAYKNKPTLRTTFDSMKNRCNNPNNRSYKNYGGRGIKVCEEWQSFKNFNDDMLSTYKKGLSLDRIDNNGDYCKENCRWATKKEQNNNSRKNHLFNFKGMILTLTGWSKITGIKRSTLAQRLYVYKWSLDQTLLKGGQIG